MSPKEFKEHFNKKIIDAIQQKCQERNLIFSVLSDNKVSHLIGLDPNKNKVLQIERDVYTIYNDGDRVDWRYIGYTN